jgi:hypothetical protein
LSCFTPGTLIATPTGERPVETLAVGQKILTRDHGPQVLRRVVETRLDYANLVARPHLRPILLRKSGLGQAVPENDMLISPNHRVLVGADHTVLELEDHEALVAAKHLVHNSHIRVVDTLGVTYILPLFDRHQIVLANGLWVEAFNPADHSLNGLGNAQRSEIEELFPGLAAELPQPRRATVFSRLERMGLSFFTH